MKKSLLPVTRLLITLAGISFASLLTAQPTLAQLNSVDAGGNNSDNQNTYDLNSGNFNMFDIIHRANLGIGTFDSNRQNDQIDEAARAFRDKQNQINGNNQQPGLSLPNSQITTSPNATGTSSSSSQLLLPNQK